MVSIDDEVASGEARAKEIMRLWRGRKREVQRRFFVIGL